MRSDGRRALPKGYELKIVEETNRIPCPVVINEEIGRGGTCIVYKGERKEAINGVLKNRSVIVKEFYPSGLEIARSENQKLDLTGLDIQGIELYKKLQEHFGEGQANSVDFYDYYKDQSLPRPFIYGESNNTVYAVSDPSKGKTLSEIPFDGLSLDRVASIMESICDAISKIHAKRMLYLDCKPDNFFYYYRNKDLQAKVYLFDFDTIVSIDDIQSGNYTFCSASKGWIPPEQSLTRGGYRDPQSIGYHTDIFSVGAIFFWLLTQRAPTDMDMRAIQEDTFDWETESSLCRGEDKEIIDLVQDTLQSMLQIKTEVRQEMFRHYLSIKIIKKQFECIYGLTCGDNVHFKPLHHEISEIKQSIQKILSVNQNSARAIRNGNNDQSVIEHGEAPHYKLIYSKELHTSSIEEVAEVIARRILKGELFSLELDEQILPIINRIIYNRKEYTIECENDMVKVPMSSFIMGGPNKTRNYPIKVDYIPYDYWIDLTPVTIGQYREYLEDAGEINNYGHRMEPKAKNHYPSPDINYGITGPKLYIDYYNDHEYDDYPVTFVDWWDAYAYAKWAGKDLPFEKEWEKAARGVDGRIYPFGNEYNSDLCNTDESNVGNLTSVFFYTHGVSPYGCFDMSGNVWEWCADDYHLNQPNMLKVVKGGSFRRGQNKAMSYACNPREPMERWIARGFRCVRRMR